jgi:hypothetical protein
MAGGKKLYSLSVVILLQEEELRSRLRSWWVNGRRQSPFEVTILFVPVSAGLEQLAVSWADDLCLAKTPAQRSCNIVTGVWRELGGAI